MQWTEGPKSKRQKFITKGKVTFILGKKYIKQRHFYSKEHSAHKKVPPYLKTYLSSKHQIYQSFHQ